MSRLQLALNVDDLESSIAFYSALFGTEPHKIRRGYANFAVAEPPLKLVLLENPGRGGSVNHLGVEVEDVEAVDAELTRLTAPGVRTRRTHRSGVPARSWASRRASSRLITGVAVTPWSSTEAITTNATVDHSHASSGTS